MPQPLRNALIVLLAAGVAGCDASTPREPAGAGGEVQLEVGGAAALARADAIRQRHRTALARQDLAAARAAVSDLEKALPTSGDAALEVARLYGAIGEMNRARWLLQEAVEAYPGRNDLVLGLAETSLRVGDGAGALQTLERVPEGAAEYPYSRLLVARAHVLLGDLERALGLLEIAEERFPETRGFRLERIEMLQVEKRYDDALALVREKQAERGLPDDVGGWLALREVEIVGASEGPQAALALLEPLLEADPASVDVLERRFAILGALGRPGDAVTELEAGLERDPDSSGLYALLAHARMAAGDAPGAEQVLRDDVARAPSVVSLTNLARFLHHLGRSGEGADVLARLGEAPDSAAAVESRYLQVAMLIEADRLPEARRGLAAFQADYPGNPRVDYLLARVDLVTGDPASAARRLTQAVSRLDRPDLKHLLGVALELSGDIEGAEQRYGLATLQDPQQVPSWVGLLRTLERQAKWQRVLEVAGSLIRVAPVSAAAYAALAKAYLALGQPEQAEQVLTEYAASFPKLSGPQVALIYALRRQGRLEDALSALDEADAAFPADPGLAAERAVVLGLLGRPGEGLEVVGSAREAVGDSAELRRATLYLLFASGRRDEGLAEADRIAALDPYETRALVMTADFLASRGEFALAAPRYEAALGRGALDAGIAFRLGVALDRSGQTQGAIAAYRRALEIDESAVRPRNNLAVALQRVGRVPEALEAAQAAYALADSDPVVMDTLGFLYLEAGRGARALALLEKARAADPASQDVEYHLALAYREAGRDAEARRLLAALSQRLEPGDELHEPVGEALASLR